MGFVVVTGFVDVVTGMGMGVVIGPLLDVVMGVYRDVVGGKEDGDSGEHRAILLES
jgi:uncharacterized membrane protein YfcA